MKIVTSIFKILLLQALGLVLLAAWFWLEEWYDLPHYLFGAAATPFNRVEVCTEIGILSVFGIIAIGGSYFLLRRIKHLEGLLPMCAYCKRIRTDGNWQEVEAYIQNNSEAVLTHGYCPDCIREHFSEDIVRRVEAELASSTQHG